MVVTVTNFLIIHITLQLPSSLLFFCHGLIEHVFGHLQHLLASSMQHIWLSCHIQSSVYSASWSQKAIKHLRDHATAAAAAAA